MPSTWIPTNLNSRKLVEHFLSIIATRIIQDEPYICPQRENFFRAFSLVQPQDVKVIIIGQDPYHTPGVADGLAFSVPCHIRRPPSLNNIQKAIVRDTEINSQWMPDGDNNDLCDLQKWAEQGVLLVNTALSVKEHEPLSHRSIGWENVVRLLLLQVPKGTITLCWGKQAFEFLNYHALQDHFVILTAGHPSPLSYTSTNFENCFHFSQANKLLQSRGTKMISWK